MKPSVSVLCLLVAVMAAPAGTATGEDTENQPRRDAPAPRVREVRFAGHPAFEPDELKEILEAIEIRRLIPGVWTQRPPYGARAVEADLVRLHSFYFSNGYFDARVRVGDVTVDRREATLTLEVQSGPKYAVRHLKIDGLSDAHAEIFADPSGEFRPEPLCTCLLDARQVAESHGRIDFAVELDVSQAAGPAPTDTDRKWVDVTARVRTGPPFAVGRINFSGHRSINESTLRRALVLRERSLFDVGKLRTSLARLNRSGPFEPLTLHDVEIQKSPDTRTADLTISLRERSGRRWSVSGPIGPAAVAGLLQASISARLPPWGRGFFEASTYSITFSLTGFSNPLVHLVPILARRGPTPWLFLERPYLPGQVPFSGFALSPQLSARALLAGYGLTHLDRRAQTLLAGGMPDSSGLLVPVSGPRPSGGDGSEEVRLLICNPPTPPYQWLRRGAALAAELALGAFRPF